MERYIWYVNDILTYVVYTEAKPQAIVGKVLQQGVKHKLLVNPLKIWLYVLDTIFLVYVINILELKIDSTRYKPIFKYASPTKTKEVYVFLWFINY